LKIKGFKQWLDDLGRNERCPCPPNYTAFLEMPDGTCVCVPSEDMKNMECRIRRSDDLDESVKEALVLNRPVEFNLTDSVTARITDSGIFLQIGDGKFFQVPPNEHQRVWDIISDRLMAS
jgi:hypothetical protein